MALSETIRREVETKLARYCERRAPREVRERVRIGFELHGDSVTIHEERPAIGAPGSWVRTNVAQARFDPAAKRWALCRADACGRWHRYKELEPTASIEALLAAMDRAPAGVFWG